MHCLQTLRTTEAPESFDLSGLQSVCWLWLLIQNLASTMYILITLGEIGGNILHFVFYAAMTTGE